MPIATHEIPTHGLNLSPAWSRLNGCLRHSNRRSHLGPAGSLELTYSSKFPKESSEPARLHHVIQINASVPISLFTTLESQQPNRAR